MVEQTADGAAPAGDEIKKAYLPLTFILVFSSSLIAQSGDRVYTAEQNSNAVSVIDPATNKLLGSIYLGEDVPLALSPLYRGELLVHGLALSPDHKTLDIFNRL